MPECIDCGQYTKYTNGRCMSCYKQFKTAANEEEKDGKKATNPKQKGLLQREKQYRYNMIKGRIAETLIQELFLSLGFNVFRYGMENTIPGIMDLLKGVRGDVANDIRRMPDFVVQDPRNKAVYFIEVKFRANGTFYPKDLDENYPFGNAYIIIVSKKHIKCITVDELRAGEAITATSRNYLNRRKEFDLDKEVIIEFCQFAVKFFENV